MFLNGGDALSGLGDAQGDRNFVFSEYCILVSVNNNFLIEIFVLSTEKLYFCSSFIRSIGLIY
jgi:hypothetical protein